MKQSGMSQMARIAKIILLALIAALLGGCVSAPLVAPWPQTGGQKYQYGQSTSNGGGARNK